MPILRSPSQSFSIAFEGWPTISLPKSFSPKNQGPKEINIIGKHPFFPQQNPNPSMTQQLEHMDVDDFDTAPLTEQALMGAIQRSFLVARPRQQDGQDTVDGRNFCTS